MLAADKRLKANEEGIGQERVSRINVIALSLLRYLAQKNQPMGFSRLHLEWSFCVTSSKWDMTDIAMRQLLKTMIKNDLIDQIDGEKEILYAITPSGFELIEDFVSIDQNILNERWKK
jgi:predicted transcriptional regulator